MAHPTAPRMRGIDVRPRAKGGTTYRVRVPHNGTTRYASFTDDLPAALRWQEQTEAAIASGLPLPAAPSEEKPAPRPAAPQPSTTTVDGAAARLLAGIERGEIRNKRGEPYKPSAVRKYEGALRLYVIPNLGQFKMATLKRGDVQRAIDQIAARHGVEQAVSTLTALRVVVHAAERYGELDTDPCAGVKAPRSTTAPRQVPVLDTTQCEALLAAAARDDEGNHLRPPGSFILPMVRLGQDTGLRLGEVLALRWGPQGIDLDAGIVNVTQAIDRKLDPELLEYPVIAPKSRKSRRQVPIAADTVRVMRAHRMATGRPADGALVWAQPDGRPIPPQGKARAAWRRVRKAAGMDNLRFHDLRHVFATHALASGTGLHATADLLGQEDAGLVERRYGHALPAEVASAAERLAAWRASQGS